MAALFVDSLPALASPTWCSEPGTVAVGPQCCASTPRAGQMQVTDPSLVTQLRAAAELHVGFKTEGRCSTE